MFRGIFSFSQKTPHWTLFVTTPEIEILKQKAFKDLETTWNFLLKETTNMMLKIVFLLISKSHLPGGRLNGHRPRTRSIRPLSHLLRSWLPNPIRGRRAFCPHAACTWSGLLWPRATNSTAQAGAQSQRTYQSVPLSNHGRADITE